MAEPGIIIGKLREEFDYVPSEDELKRLIISLGEAMRILGKEHRYQVSEDLLEKAEKMKRHVISFGEELGNGQ